MRILKWIGISAVGLLTLLIVAAWLFPGDGKAHYLSADESRACTKAKISEDASYIAFACDPEKWRQFKRATGN